MFSCTHVLRSGPRRTPWREPRYLNDPPHPSITPPFSKLPPSNCRSGRLLGPKLLREIETGFSSVQARQVYHDSITRQLRVRSAPHYSDSFRFTQIRWGEQESISHSSPAVESPASSSINDSYFIFARSCLFGDLTCLQLVQKRGACSDSCTWPWMLFIGQTWCKSAHTDILLACPAQLAFALAAHTLMVISRFRVVWHVSRLPAAM